MLICKQQITLSNRISVVAVELVRSRINCIMKWARSLVLSLPRAFAIVAFQLTDQCGFTDVLSKLFELERLKSFWPVRYRNGNQFFNIYKFHLGYVICHCISLFSPTIIKISKHTPILRVPWALLTHHPASTSINIFPSLISFILSFFTFINIVFVFIVIQLQLSPFFPHNFPPPYPCIFSSKNFYQDKS